MFWQLVAAIPGWIELWQLPLGMLSGPAGWVALAAVAAAVLVATSRHARSYRNLRPRSPVLARAVALRERSRRTAYLRQRDPSARGRPRPRAPSVGRAAA